ncbi:CDP-glycerol--glycerophosphate glycerophosphotransferase [Ectopseudomonas khazarica]|uniref:CDP-glycerol--glycerophosphate glycerophosphotransferase n=1 Tax=Ectopseudomonas khazarica TaxID=2502979 RepID=UPI0006459D0F
MKIDKRRPSHWFQLMAFALQALLGLPLRTITQRTAVVLYGHKLNGNLLALYRQCPQAIFLSMDLRYCRELEAQGIRCQWACNFGAARLMARATALVSDHGLHSLEMLLSAYRRSGLKCFDVWHGIPFKGFDEDDFHLQHRYDETWVASELHRSLYIERYGFTRQQAVVTGYARTDALINPGQNAASLRQELGLPPQGRLILFAPTWAQDTRERNLFPFGHEPKDFLDALAALARRYQATVLLRTHLNSGDQLGSDYPDIICMPSSQWPNAESILQVSDMLICDWSSIAFDYLLLDRPTFFLDVPAPFRKGFSLGPEYRFGAVVGSLPQLLQALESALLASETYWQEYADKHRRVRQEVYGSWADGHATQRCLKRLRSHIGTTDESSR